MSDRPQPAVDTGEAWLVRPGGEIEAVLVTNTVRTLLTNLEVKQRKTTTSALSDVTSQLVGASSQAPVGV